MLTPLVRINALRLGCEFETAITKRKGIVLDRIGGGLSRSRGDVLGVEVAWQDGTTYIVHGEVKVRPITLHNTEESEEESIH